jgi:N,N'-diacetyllegionaminate synthase
MKLGNRTLDHGTLVVAEIGNNHEGSVEVAERLVREAAACGADAVKFQTFQTQYFVRPSDGPRYARMSKFELTPAEFQRLHDVARDAGVMFLSTPLDMPSVATLRPLVDAYKIASGDNTFYPLLDAVCATGLPVIISSGGTTLAELRTIYGYARQRCGSDRLALLHCVSAYPAPPAQLGLSAIQTLAGEFDCAIGYSDHTIGIQACLTAVALGARIIEKHFTLDKQFSDFRDHQLSSDPAEFRQLVQGVQEVAASLGTGDKEVRACEVEMVPAIRRSIVAAADLPAGHRLTAADLMWLRPAGGIAPGREHEVIGRALTRAVGRGDIIQPDLLD